jgi:hypothetical protein
VFLPPGSAIRALLAVVGHFAVPLDEPRRPRGTLPALFADQADR